ncbi:MAG: amino acid ABC transporter ATP-binding protein [Pseudomonadota bacterium]
MLDSAAAPDDAYLRLSGLRKRFGDNEVLRGVDLSANAREVVSLIGASGSGKSTLLRCVNLLETPDSGEIRIGGEPLFAAANGARPQLDMKRVRAARAGLGMVFQNFNLWTHLTVLENVIEAPLRVLRRPRGEAVEKAEALLARVGVADKRDAYPSSLSGGQQQRVAIARALAMEPKAMLFDEPTSALDPERVGEVLDVMRDLAEEGRTMIVVTHEIGFAREVADRAVFLKDGAIEEEGPAAEILTRPQTEALSKFLSRVL